MSKDLERFVRDNRSAFDTERPTGKVWEEIQKELKPSGQKPPVRRLRMVWLAAAAVMFAVSATLLYMNFNTGNGATDISGENTGTRSNGYIAAIDPAYAAQVNRFTAVIDEKQAELKTLQNDNPNLYEKFSSDIQKLDSTYGLLKNQLPVNPNKEELLQAMIWNLQLQINLLNQQLDIIQKIKNSNSNSL